MIHGIKKIDQLLSVVLKYSRVFVFVLFVCCCFSFLGHYIYCFYLGAGGWGASVSWGWGCFLGFYFWRVFFLIFKTKCWCCCFKFVFVLVFLVWGCFSFFVFWGATHNVLNILLTFTFVTNKIHIYFWSVLTKSEVCTILSSNPRTTEITRQATCCCHFMGYSLN